MSPEARGQPCIFPRRRGADNICTQTVLSSGRSRKVRDDLSQVHYRPGYSFPQIHPKTGPYPEGGIRWRGWPHHSSVPEPAWHHRSAFPPGRFSYNSNKKYPAACLLRRRQPGHWYSLNRPLLFLMIPLFPGHRKRAFFPPAPVRSPWTDPLPRPAHRHWHCPGYCRIQEAHSPLLRTRRDPSMNRSFRPAEGSHSP